MISLLRQWYSSQFVKSQQQVVIPKIEGMPECEQCVRLLRGRFILRLMSHMHTDHRMDPIEAQEIAARASGRLLQVLNEHRRKHVGHGD